MKNINCLCCTSDLDS